MQIQVGNSATKNFPCRFWRGNFRIKRPNGGGGWVRRGKPSWQPKPRMPFFWRGRGTLTGLAGWGQPPTRNPLVVTSEPSNTPVLFHPLSRRRAIICCCGRKQRHGTGSSNVSKALHGGGFEKKIALLPSGLAAWPSGTMTTMCFISLWHWQPARVTF